MTTVSRIRKDPYPHWNEKELDAYIYTDVLSEGLVKQVEKNVFLHLKENAVNYGTHRTTFSFSGSSHAVVKHDQNARYQQIIFDLTLQKQWWHQTSDTVVEWGNEWLKDNISPVFYQFINKMYALPPFNSEPGDWIPYRWHINMLEHDTFLCMHKDCDPKYFNDTTNSSSRILSLTYYLEDYVEGWGGDLFTLSGFVYKPKKNSAIGFNGHQVMHGVNANLKPSKEARLAFTTRWAHKDDLYLPGHPDKLIFTLE